MELWKSKTKRFGSFHSLEKENRSLTESGNKGLLSLRKDIFCLSFNKLTTRNWSPETEVTFMISDDFEMSSHELSKKLCFSEVLFIEIHQSNSNLFLRKNNFCLKYFLKIEKILT